MYSLASIGWLAALASADGALPSAATLSFRRSKPENASWFKAGLSDTCGAALVESKHACMVET